MKKLKKGGFSVVEAAIALTVVVIVSISALSVALSSVNAKQAAVTKAYAQSFANSALESFKCHTSQQSDSKDSFVSYLFSAEGCIPDPTTDDTETITYFCTPDSRPFTAVIKIKYGVNIFEESTTEACYMDTFKVVVLDKDSKTLAELSYEKPTSAQTSIDESTNESTITESTDEGVA